MTVPSIWFRLDGGPSTDEGSLRIIGTEGEELSPMVETAGAHIRAGLDGLRATLSFALGTTARDATKFRDAVGGALFGVEATGFNVVFAAQWDESLSIRASVIQEAERHSGGGGSEFSGGL